MSREFSPSTSGAVVVTRELEAAPAPAHPAPAQAPLPPRRRSALDAVLEATDPKAPQRDADVFRHFLNEASAPAALEFWLSHAPAHQLTSREDVSQLIGRDIARIDALLNAQLNTILHNPQFQQLEASWRGLKYLVTTAETDETIKIRVLTASWRDLAKDVERAAEFDQTQLWKKVYDDEFGRPGGEPYGVLIGDYQIRHRPSTDHPYDDLGVLQSIAQVAAASFAPFVGGADPALFNLEGFGQLERSLNLTKTFETPEYLKWRAFRDSEDSRFVGLAAPRVLMRLPYETDTTRRDSFCFREEVEGPDSSRYLWGNAAYAFGAVLLRSFARSGWLADIRGVTRDEVGGGVVNNLPIHSFGTEKWGVAAKFSTDVIIGDHLEKELGDLGFIPLCHCKDTDWSVFYGNQSTQKPKVYELPAATTNARMSGMLQYMLCVSRFAHYLKVMARDKVGSFADPYTLESQLTQWINGYVADDPYASPAVKAKFPLRQAQVEVRENPRDPGNFRCTMHLMPHYQLDGLTASVKLTTEMAPARSG